MRIGKEPLGQKPTWQQDSLDFSKKSRKDYPDYSDEERRKLEDSIRAKRKTGKPLTEEERKFVEADKRYFDDDQPNYFKGH